ncbi:hypothetical protein [Absidia glauca]|uniref:BZIP domain-containing protein n=1 Tax=Absidia glauca TaxID=4829 RepID=A0A168R162_ABSGL|nr:hypothetical protein [Absidia glauca]
MAVSVQKAAMPQGNRQDVEINRKPSSSPHKRGPRRHTIKRTPKPSKKSQLASTHKDPIDEMTVSVQKAAMPQGNRQDVEINRKPSSSPHKRGPRRHTNKRTPKPSKKSQLASTHKDPIVHEAFCCLSRKANQPRAQNEAEVETPKMPINANRRRRRSTAKGNATCKESTQTSSSRSEDTESDSDSFAVMRRRRNIEASERFRAKKRCVNKYCVSPPTKPPYGRNKQEKRA